MKYDDATLVAKIRAANEARRKAILEAASSCDAAAADFDFYPRDAQDTLDNVASALRRIASEMAEDSEVVTKALVKKTRKAAL